MEKVTLNELLKLDRKKLVGKIICFPTDTVYGVGAMANDTVAINKIYEMKNRSSDKPLPILCSNIEMVEGVAIVNKKAKELMKKYWPGALTLIINKKENVLPNYLDTIAFRMPNSKIALSIIDHFSLFATTSINTSGEAEINDLDEIEEKFSKYLDYLVIDKEKMSEKASTILDVTGDDVKVIRIGDIKIA